MDGIRFLKGHGTENDFVLLPDPDGALALTPRLVAAICDRRAGVGADGVLRVVRAAKDPDGVAMAGEAEWFMDYSNADGSLAQMCGNGARVFARYLVIAGLAAPGAGAIATRAGVKAVYAEGDGDSDVTVDMGRPSWPAAGPLTVRVGGKAWPAVAVDMGNPHAVVFVDDLADAGPLIEAPVVDPPSAFPGGVNIEFATLSGSAHVAMRVHERGVGETRSCGTGACAVVVAARRHVGGTGEARAEAGAPTWTVDVPGGRLRVTERADRRLELAGPAVLVAAGTLRPEWVTAHM